MKEYGEIRGSSPNMVVWLYTGCDRLKQVLHGIQIDWQLQLNWSAIGGNPNCSPMVQPVQSNPVASLSGSPTLDFNTLTISESPSRP